MELASGCQLSQVETWLRQEATTQLVEFIRKRHRERFFGPIDYLRQAPDNLRGYGFSIMSISCLLTETIQCYREGIPTTNRREWTDLLRIQEAEPVPAEFRLPPDLPLTGREAFHRFFVDYNEFFPSVDGGIFYDNIRNGLLHQGQTKKGWTLNTGGALCDPVRQNINRNLFADALSDAFEKYLRELRQNRWKSPVWRNATRKIWWLIRISK